LIDDLRSEFAKKAMEKDVQLSVNFNCDTNYSLMSDEEKLKKTLSHIIDNAIKFSGHKSKVIIYCNYLNSNAIEFVIKDNGIGISKDQLNQVHLPFFITDLDNKAGIHGTGLGLAIAKAYIENLGGQLHIKSELGEGTEVSFQLMDYNKKAP
jgi:signal transduction histidine kinase